MQPAYFSFLHFLLISVFIYERQRHYSVQAHIYCAAFPKVYNLTPRTLGLSPSKLIPSGWVQALVHLVAGFEDLHEARTMFVALLEAVNVL